MNSAADMQHAIALDTQLEPYTVSGEPCIEFHG